MKFYRTLKTLFVIITSLNLLMCSTRGTDPDYREQMRQFVQGISSYAKTEVPGFIIIPQNGAALATLDSEADGAAAEDYLDAIDGQGQEDLFYGFNNDDEATPSAERDYIINFLDIEKSFLKTILAIDYCSTTSYMADSYTQNYTKGYISFAAQHRELDFIATYPAVPYGSNTNSIASLSSAANFLYIINPQLYSTKAAFLAALADTDYDLIIMDLFFDGAELTAADIASISTKKSGGTRLVVAYMSIGEAEDYRYYWDSSWSYAPPSWLDAENPDWEGNYKVKYWDPAWQEIIYGNDSSYLKKIIDAGFDGVYLDIIDAFEYYE